jgi:hypothetical protein
MLVRRKMRQAYKWLSLPPTSRPPQWLHLLLMFLEHNFVILPAGIIGGIVAVIFPPLFIVLGICFLLGLHRSKAVAGRSRLAQAVAYLLLSAISFFGLYKLNNRIQTKLSESNTALARLVVSFQQKAPTTDDGQSELRVEEVGINVYPHQPISGRVKVGSHGKRRVSNPRRTLSVIVTDRLGEVGERHLFENMSKAMYFTFGDERNPPVNNENGNVPLSSDLYDQIKSGKKFAYLMILLQYGPELFEPFDDGISRAHTLFCAYFSRGVPGTKLMGPYYCNGFNYAKP